MRGPTAYLSVTLDIGSPRFLYEVVEVFLRIVVEAIKFEQHSSGLGRVGVRIIEDIEDVKVRVKGQTERPRGLEGCPRSSGEVCCKKHSPRWDISHTKHILSVGHRVPHGEVGNPDWECPRLIPF